MEESSNEILPAAHGSARFEVSIICRLITLLVHSDTERLALSTIRYIVI